MVTRKRYPSDHRRWFRVNEDILDDPKLSAVPADVFRFYFRLLAMLNRTKSFDGKIALDRWALNACSMRDRHGAALALARCGAGAGLVRLRYENGTAFIEVPNWPKIQQFTPADLRRDSDKTPAPKTTPKTTPTTKKERERENAPSAPDSPPARRVLVDKPTDFPDDSKDRIRKWAEAKGFDPTILDAGLELFREWVPIKPPYRRPIEAWEAAFKKITRESIGRVNPNGQLQSNRESPAQAKARRTKEAAAKAYDMVMARKQQLGLTEITGGITK